MDKKDKRTKGQKDKMTKRKKRQKDKRTKGQKHKRTKYFSKKSSSVVLHLRDVYILVFKENHNFI